MSNNKNPKNKKLSIREYLKQQELFKKKRFHFEPYPWPVMVALLIPLSVFILLLITYFLYISHANG